MLFLLVIHCELTPFGGGVDARVWLREARRFLLAAMLALSLKGSHSPVLRLP